MSKDGLDLLTNEAVRRDPSFPCFIHFQETWALHEPLEVDRRSRGARDIHPQARDDEVPAGYTVLERRLVSDDLVDGNSSDDTQSLDTARPAGRPSTHGRSGPPRRRDPRARSRGPCRGLPSGHLAAQDAHVRAAQGVGLNLNQDLVRAYLGHLDLCDLKLARSAEHRSNYWARTSLVFRGITS
jgi:hypothetical protein